MFSALDEADRRRAGVGLSRDEVAVFVVGQQQAALVRQPVDEGEARLAVMGRGEVEGPVPAGGRVARDHANPVGLHHTVGDLLDVEAVVVARLDDDGRIRHVARPGLALDDEVVAVLVVAETWRLVTKPLMTWCPPSEIATASPGLRSVTERWPPVATSLALNEKTDTPLP